MLALASPAVRLQPQTAAPARTAIPVMQYGQFGGVLQGGSLRTWNSPYGQGNQVELGTDGRPLDANVELWQGPGNTPVRMRVYGEDGGLRPISASIPSDPYGRSNTMAIRNAGPLEFPINANFGQDVGPSPEHAATARTIQGGSLKTFQMDSSVQAVQVLLQSEGLPIYATVEVLQGPNNNKQAIELYSDDGSQKPVFYTLETPGYGSVVQVTNRGPMEFPITASVVPEVSRFERGGFGNGGFDRRFDQGPYDGPWAFDGFGPYSGFDGGGYGGYGGYGGGFAY